jgi:hypothetical protein
MHGSYKDQLKRAIHESQKCQRNWDLDKEMPQEDVDLIMEAVTHCPSRQNINFFDVSVITNRDTIEKIHSATECFPIDPSMKLSDYSKAVSEGSDRKNREERDKAKNPTPSIEFKTNPQTLAHLLLAFSANEDTKYDDVCWTKDVLTSVGIAAGYVKLISTQLGYASGCCGCMEEEINTILGSKVFLLMGVGIPDESKHRTEHHYEDFRFPSFSSVKTHSPVKVNWYN